MTSTSMCSAWLILPALLGAAAGPPAGRETPTFPVETRVVALDVVATGRDGRPLDDLRPDELQVLENGRPCEVRSFRLIRATPSSERSAARDMAAEKVAAAPSSAGPPVVAPPLRTNLIVLFFDRLTIESGPLARQGALDFLARNSAKDTRFAVFSGVRRQFVVPFTTDLVAVRNGVEAATFGSTPRAGAAREAPSQGQQTLAGSERTVPPSVAEVAGRSAALESAALQIAGDLDTVYAIEGVVRALEGIQGRKTILYFAEGWQFSLEVRPQYEEAISAATRANVTVHTFDARGLAYRKLVAVTPLDRVLESLSAEHRGGPFGGSMTPVTDDKGTPAVRLAGPNLEELAEDTGGRATANTNDLRLGLAAISEELRHYYEIVYAPADPANDGRFRRISVKVSRPGVRIRTRKGYFATPRDASALPAYELPLREALAAEVPARDFELRAGVLHFAPHGNERECVVVAEVPLSEVPLASDETSGFYNGRLTLLGFLRDERGEVIARLGQNWTVEGPPAERERARVRTVTFRRTLPLTPGRYLLELAAQDLTSGGRSVTRAPFEVPPGESGLALGSVVIVRTTSAPGSAGDPLRVGDVTVLPRLGEPLESGSRGEVPVFVSVYPKGAEPVELSASLRSGEGVVAEAKAVLPVADSSGRVNWIGRIPSAGLRPGDYEVVVTARQSALHAEERTPLHVVPGGSALAEAVEPRTPTGDASLVPILERAARYVVGYEESFRNVVAEETYSQLVFVGTPFVTGLMPGVPSAPGLGPTTPAPLLDKSYRRRRTRADLVFVRLTGDVPWSLFRDVFEVDGRKVRDRDRRLQMLFQHPSPSALTQARRIVDESARYNIGGAARTINVPTMPLVFLHPRNQSRFSFAKGGQRWISGVEALEIRFEEVARPTVVTTSSGDSLPAHGSFWIDSSRGAVLRSEVVFRFEPSLAEASVETDYELQPSLRLWVPVEMKERYRNLPHASRSVFGAPTEATARYSNFRQFTVTVEDGDARLEGPP